MAGEKILVTLSSDEIKWVNNWVKKLNDMKEPWTHKTNRQETIRACVRYAMKFDAQVRSKYSKHAYLESKREDDNGD